MFTLQWTFALKAAGFLVVAEAVRGCLPVQVTSLGLLGNEVLPEVVGALDYFNGKVLKHKTQQVLS